MTRRKHATPLEAVGECVRERVTLGEFSFDITRPASGDALFDHPAVRAAFGADQYVPYWAELWPASRMLAKAVLAESWPTGRPLRTLEIACGLGLAGIAGLARGLSVTFSDLDELAVTFAAGNARLNGFTAFATAVVDLRQPPPGEFDVILGADLLYDDKLVDALVEFLPAALAPGGLALVADPDRRSARHFGYRAMETGLRVTTSFARAGVPGGERTKGTVYRAQRPDAEVRSEEYEV